MPFAVAMVGLPETDALPRERLITRESGDVNCAGPRVFLCHWNEPRSEVRRARACDHAMGNFPQVGGVGVDSDDERIGRDARVMTYEGAVTSSEVDVYRLEGRRAISQ